MAAAFDDELDDADSCNYALEVRAHDERLNKTAKPPLRLTMALLSPLSQVLINKFVEHGPESDVWKDEEWEGCLQLLLDTDSLPSFGLY